MVSELLELMHVAEHGENFAIIITNGEHTQMRQMPNKQLGGWSRENGQPI
jgi:hypothetical protein